MMDTQQIIDAGKLLPEWIGANQWAAITEGLAGEERAHYLTKLIEYAERIRQMPTSFQTDGQGEHATAQLHYFLGGSDWYVIEKDLDPDGEGQQQAFGLADLYGDGGELGYLNLPEIIAAGAELDLYWTPATLEAIRARR